MENIIINGKLKDDLMIIIRKHIEDLSTYRIDYFHKKIELYSTNGISNESIIKISKSYGENLEDILIMNSKGKRVQEFHQN